MEKDKGSVMSPVATDTHGCGLSTINAIVQTIRSLTLVRTVQGSSRWHNRENMSTQGITPPHY